MDDRKLMWCSKHGEPAWLYRDGSHSCWYDSIVEAITKHTLVELPEIERLRALITEYADAWDDGGVDAVQDGHMFGITIRRLDASDALREEARRG